MAKAKTKVLIVDDVPANIVALEQVLKPLDVDILKAYNGKEAVGQILRHTDLALILLDVQMPEMDGFEVAELIREDDEVCHIPIIFVTAISTQDAYVFKGYQAGAVDYLFKPVDGDILLSKVRVFVQLYEQKHALAETLDNLRQVENARSLLLQNAYEGIMGLDADNTVNFVNPAACELLGYEEEELLGQLLKNIAAPNMSEREWADSHIMQTQSAHSKQHVEEWTFTQCTGREFSVEFTQVSIVEKDCLIGSVILFRDVTERIQAQKKLIKLAQHDALTGIANRSLFWNLLGKSIANGKRHNTPFALFYIDLDRFKQVNDSLGHLAGDLLLTKASERIVDCVREEDYVARLGGDEFAVVAHYIDSSEMAGELAQRIIESLGMAFDIFQQDVFIGASIGVAMFPDHGEDVKTLTGNADIAMYAAKKSGRNKFNFFNEEMQKLAEGHVELTKQIQQAILIKALKMRTQNLLSQGKDVFGTAMVLYWPEYPSLEQSLLFQLADACQKGKGLRSFYIDKLLEECHKRLEGSSERHNVLIDLNLSAYDIQSHYLSNIITRILAEEAGNKINYLVCVNETVLNHNPAKSEREIQLLVDQGLQVCVTGFGEDVSKIGFLMSLPIAAIRLSKKSLNCLRAKEREKFVRFASQLCSGVSLTMLIDANDYEQHLNILSKASHPIIVIAN